MRSVVETADMRVRFSTLWIFASINYVYADVVTLFDKTVVTNLSQASLLAFAALVETSFAMIPLSRFLKYKANRLANILVGVIQTVAIAASLLVASPAGYYVLFATFEIATTLIIVWQALVWRQ